MSPNPSSPSQSKWTQSRCWSQSTPMTHWSLTFSRANLLHHFSPSLLSGVHIFITNVIKLALHDSIGRKYKEHTTNRGVDKKSRIVASSYKRLTPNQPVSVIPPQCQKLLEVGAPMWPAAKQAPRSAVHGWTRPVYLPKEKRTQAYFGVIISILTYDCLSEVFARPPLSNKASLSVIASMSSAFILILAIFFSPVWWLQVWFAGAEWGELEWPEAQQPPFEQSNLLVLLDWWGFLLGKCIHLFH